jgi:hypothetical protein
MFKRLIQWFKNLFSKTETLASSATPVQPTQSPSQPTKVLSLDTREGWDAWRNGHVPSTRNNIPEWERKLEIDKLIAASQGPAVDRSGFELNASNGYLVTPLLTNGQVYTFILGKPGTVEVSGWGGNQVLRVNGQSISPSYVAHIPNQSGSISLSVESLDGRVMVQVV